MWENPLKLISASRLDVFARTEFALRRIQGHSDNWSRTLYRAFLAANRVDGTEIENGTKATVRDYLQSFERVIDSIQERGFQQSLGAVPVQNGMLVNGAHRLAAALVANQPIFISETDDIAACYDYRWLRKRGMSSLFVDAMAMNLIRISTNVRAIVLFGESDSIVDLVEDEIRTTSEVVIRKKLNLTEIGKRRIVDLAYSHNDWWDMASLLEKMTAERFSESPPQCHIIFTLESQLEDLQRRKEKLRTILPLKHFERRLHGSDHYFDSVRLAEVALNQNSRMFLNLSPIGSEQRIITMLGGDTQQYAPRLTHQEWCIDGSAVLEMFGLRDARDIDYLAVTDMVLPPMLRRIGHNHVEEYNDGKNDPFEIINDPRNHFIYKGFKFISLRAQLVNKINEPDLKSVSDVQLIVNATNAERGLYQSLDMQISGSMSRLRFRFISLTDRLLRRLPNGMERRVRLMISNIRVLVG